MIEIKCTATEQERLLEVLAGHGAKCPFIGLCTELPYYKTGISHRECIENNILWVITNEKPEADKIENVKVIISVEEFSEAASHAALEYYQPVKKPENLQEFFASTGYAATLMSKLFDKEDK